MGEKGAMTSAELAGAMAAEAAEQTAGATTVVTQGATTVITAAGGVLEKAADKAVDVSGDDVGARLKEARETRRAADAAQGSHEPEPGPRA